MRIPATGPALAGVTLTLAGIGAWSLGGDGGARKGAERAPSMAVAPAAGPMRVAVDTSEAPRRVAILEAPAPRPAPQDEAVHPAVHTPADTETVADATDAEAATARAAALELQTERERAAVATLRSVCSAQQQLQASVRIDTDGDGGGEYGYFAELAGTATVLRKHDAELGAILVPVGDALRPAFLAEAFGALESFGGQGVVRRAGYFFQIYLPAAPNEATVAGLAEASTGGPGQVLPDAKLAEVIWCAYAWPAEASDVPMRTFFMNQEGDVISCGGAEGNPAPYAGARSPRFDAALSRAVPRDMNQPLGLAALGNAANDGELWIVPAQ